MRKQRGKKFLFGVLALLFVGLFAFATKTAHATGPNLINFQGKVVNADGTNVANGSYNFDFVLYDDASLGTPSDGVHDKWHELTKSVTVTNGVFQTELGSATTLPDFNTNSSLYLAIRFNGDAQGYMSPRVHLDSVPYARNADAVGGVTASSLARVDALSTFAAGLTVTTGQNFTVNGDTFTDLTGNGLTVSSGALTIAANSLDFTELKDALVLDASTSVAFGASNFGLTFNDNGSADYTINLSSTGDFVIQDNGTPALTITDTGSALFKTTVASSTGFQIQDSAGSAVENYNTLTVANLIGNPNFEVSLNGWALRGSSTIAYTDTAANVKFGARALQINATTAAGDGAKYNVALPVSGTFTISWYDSVASGSIADIIAGYSLDGSAETNCTSINTQAVAALPTWTQHTCTITTTSTAPSGASYVYIKQSGAQGSTHTIYVDGVTLVQSATAYTFTNPANNFDITTATNGLVFNSNNSGQLSAWQLSPNALANVRQAGASVVSNGYIYQIAGYSGIGGLSNVVTYANINADGSTGSWANTSSVANGVAEPRQYPAAVATNGYLYVIGGYDGTLATSSVFYSKLNSDGTVGTWYCQGALTAAGCNTSGTAINGNGLPAARVGAAAVVSNGYIYVIGGCSDNSATCGTPVNTVYYAKLQADGSTGAWSTSASTLSQSRGMLTAAFENGNLIAMGGRNSTGVTTVDKAQISSTGDLSASFSTTSMTALPANRQEHTSAIANGYIYVIGGSDGAASPARQSTVYYSKLNSGGTNSTWQTGTALPALRSAQSTAIANGYIYAIGGCGFATAGACGNNEVSTVYYASTPRVLVGGSLDLVGLSSQSLSDFGGAGALSAGNGRFIGELKVDGYADFNNGLSVDSGLNINAVSATAGQAVLNINNSSSNSIFSVRHMGTQFGSLIKGGAFEGRNSYFGEEFNVGKTSCAPAAAAGSSIGGYARGDLGGNGGTLVACSATANANVGIGELNASKTTTGTSAICSFASQNVANGVERITSTSSTGSNASNCEENLAATGTTSNKIYSAANLPVITMKVKASTLTASDNNARIYVGLSDRNATTDTNGAGMPTNGIFFSNCSTWSATAPTGCSTSTWYGYSVNASANTTPVTCSNGASIGALVSQFSYLRIEVRSSTDVHFFVDYNTADGINESECGTGTSATPSAALTAWFQAMYNGNSALTTALDIDYFRSWQDDNVPIQNLAPDNTTTTPDGSELISTAPVTLDSTSPDGPNGFFSFNAATSEDTVFNKDVYVRGTLYANKIKANQIEGLEVLTDKISSLQNSLAQSTAPSTTTSSVSASTQSGLSNIQAVNLVALAQLESRGGLIVDKDAQFNGKTIFQLLAEFNGNVNFNKQVTFNNDVGGTALIKKGAQKVQVKFSNPYSQTPIIVASWATDSDKSDDQAELFAAGYNFLVTKADQNGFWIYLNKPTTGDVKLNWLATAVKDAKITTSEPVE